MHPVALVYPSLCHYCVRVQYLCAVKKKPWASRTHPAKVGPMPRRGLPIDTLDASRCYSAPPPSLRTGFSVAAGVGKRMPAVVRRHHRTSGVAVNSLKLAVGTHSSGASNSVPLYWLCETKSSSFLDDILLLIIYYTR